MAARRVIAKLNAGKWLITDTIPAYKNYITGTVRGGKREERGGRGWEWLAALVLSLKLFVMKMSKNLRELR